MRVFPTAVIGYDEDRSMVVKPCATPQEAACAAKVAAATGMFPRVGWVWLIQPVISQVVPDVIAKHGAE